MIREVFRCHKAAFSGVDIIIQPSARCKGLEAAKFEQVLLNEYAEAMGAEVRDGKRSNLSDQERSRIDAR